MILDERPSSISHSRSLDEMADFWEAHDATEFEAQTHEVEMRCALSQHGPNVTDDLTDDSLEELLERNPTLLESIRRARQQLAEGKGISLAEARAKYDAKSDE